MRPAPSSMTTIRIAIACAVLTLIACSSGTTASARQRAFSTPEDAVRALIDAAKAGDMTAVAATFGPGGQQLIDTSDPVTVKRNREVFLVAVGEKWQLVDQGTDTKVLVIGNERWDFPVPLVKVQGGWQFDTAAGQEEIIARRIGRNELAAIRICRTYIEAQRLYAERGHDGLKPGLYAAAFRSAPGRHNGLYWPMDEHEKRSPLGDMVARATETGKPPGKDDTQPSPFHGYYFRILTAQGKNAPGGSKDYIVNGGMSGGFALVAWPAQYDVTGIMTFIVNDAGVVHEQDLGTTTDHVARTMQRYNPSASWKIAQ
jgi:hypothetical protein